MQYLKTYLKKITDRGNTKLAESIEKTANDVGNKHSPTVIAAAITSQTGKTKLPTHIEIEPEKSGLKADSVILTEQIRTIDKSRLKEKIGHIDDNHIMSQINNALGVSFGLD